MMYILFQSYYFGKNLHLFTFFLLLFITSPSITLFQNLWLLFRAKVVRTMFNPFPNNPWFLCDCSISLLKTLWEKEKLLVTRNFSFSHIVFYLFGKLSVILPNLKLSSADSFCLEQSKICRLGKG